VSQRSDTCPALDQWGHFRKLPDASDRTVVGMNLDVLVSMANNASIFAKSGDTQWNLAAAGH
jgi:hypothetical protein